LGAGAEKLEALDPLLLEHFRGNVIRKVCCGEAHSVAITEMGDLFVWGRGREVCGFPACAFFLVFIFLFFVKI
jgi:alpha-tubulin suppressor-like RCC1 family protein